MSISIDGVHLKNDLGLDVMIDGTEDELLPEVQSYSVNVPGRHGEYAFKSWMQPRNFSARVLIPPQETRTNTQLVARELSRLFLDDFGNPKQVELIFDFEPDKFYTVKLNSGMAIERIRKAGFADFDLRANDPYAYSTTTNDEVTWGSEVITFENTTYTLGHESISQAGVDVTSPTTIPILVEGYAVKPIFIIEGSADSLTVRANGYEFTLPSFSNATWMIDCDKYTVLKDGDNAFGDVQLREFILRKGTNDVAIDGTNIDVNIRIIFRDRYM